MTLSGSDSDSTDGSNPFLGFVLIAFFVILFLAWDYYSQGKFEEHVVCRVPAKSASLVTFNSRGKYRIYVDNKRSLIPENSRFNHPSRARGFQMLNQKTNQLITLKPALFVSSEGRCELGTVYVSTPGQYSVIGTPPDSSDSTIVITHY